jgi:hypothetical protein
LIFDCRDREINTGRRSSFLRTARQHECYNWAGNTLEATGGACAPIGCEDVVATACHQLFVSADKRPPAAYFPAALDDGITVCKSLLKTVNPKNIGFIGTSRAARWCWRWDCATA